MGIKDMIRPGLGRKVNNDVSAQGQDDILPAERTNTSPEDGHVDEKPEEDVVPSQDVQHGVQDMEAATLSWSKRSLICVFLFIWTIYLFNAFQTTILSVLTPYVTSDFESHSLLTVINVVANSMSAAVFIPLAKILDLWGRAEGYLIMVCFSTLGLILMAVSNNLAIFCAANVFYTVGFTGLIYTIDVVTADATNLRNRALAYAFTSSPYMITTFAGSAAAGSILETIGWAWGFGIFAILLPFVAAPLFILLKRNIRKAQKEGRIVREKSGRTLTQSVWYYIIEFDALGVFLFAAGLVIFLLPFNIAGDAPNGWGTGYIIAMFVVGFVLLVAFAINELFFAPAPFLKFGFLTDRTVVGACLLDMTYQISYYCWNYYFTSFLQVVNYLTPAQAGYVENTFNVVSGVLLFIVGYGIRRTGYFKWLLWVGLPIYILAQGLMIYFRQPTGYIGYLVMCQIFISIGGSVFIICMQLAVLAAVDHQYVAAALALLSVTGTTGGAIGGAISGAIWTNTFEGALERYLPESALPDIESIYADIEVQLSYEQGSPERLGIQQAYAYSQTRMLAAGTGIMALGFVWVFIMKNYNVAKMKQTKGVVF